MDTREERRQHFLREQQIKQRLRLATTRLHEAEHERIWAIVAARDTGLSIRQIATCSGSHYLDARLAIEHPSRPTIIDSGTCVRPTLSASEPRLLILGSQSCLVGSHYWHRAVVWGMTALMRADRGWQALRTTGRINHLIQRVWPDFPLYPHDIAGLTPEKLAV
jgi:hypothetical protein